MPVFLLVYIGGLNPKYYTKKEKIKTAKNPKEKLPAPSKIQNPQQQPLKESTPPTVIESAPDSEIVSNVQLGPPLKLRSIGGDITTT